MEPRLLRRIRAHQSWYRLEVIGSAAWGTTPPPNAQEIGSILPSDYAARGGNFVSHEAHEAYLKRRTLGWGVEPYRCERYLTSSQAMTFNLFASLGNDLVWLARVIENLGIDGNGQPQELHLECQPGFRGAGHLDKTVADVFVKTDNGGIVIETKLADQFSKRRASVRARDFYEFVNRRTPLWVVENPHFEAGAQEQMARVHALGSLAANGPATLVFVHHPLDLLAAIKVEKYRGLLLDPEQLRVVRLDRFVDSLTQTALSDEQREYANRLRVRYLDMSLSEDAFCAMETARGRSRVHSKDFERPNSLKR